MEVTLVVLEGDLGEGRPAVQVPVVLGRSRSCGLRLQHPTVSRRHCQLFEVEGLVMVRDLGSLNGTLVDSRPVEQAPLKPGERLTIGPFTFQVEYEYEGEPALGGATEPAAPNSSTMPAAAAQTHLAGLLDDTTPAEDNAEPAPVPDTPGREMTAPVKKPPHSKKKPGEPTGSPAPGSEPRPPASKAPAPGSESPAPHSKPPASSEAAPPAAPSGSTPPRSPGPEDAGPQQAAAHEVDDEQLKDFLRGLS